MAYPDPNRTAQRLAFFLYSLALFHLPAGRIVYSFGDLGEIKVGSSLENLLPTILLARVLWRGLKFQEWREIFEPLREPLFLLFCGLAVCCAANLSSASLEDLARLIGQAGCGFLLAEWIWWGWNENRLWFVGLFLGFLWLGWQTPWGQLGVPSLEGPFGHRNTQSAFLILSFPLLYLLYRRRSFGMRGLGVSGLAILLVSLAFILISKSRAGALGVLTTLAILGFGSLSRPRKDNSKRLAVLGSGFVFAVVALILLSPRFRDIAQEIANPYHRSRTAIWAAAVEEWRDPSAFLVGSGMGETFDRILIDSPTGNLNFRYRRTLHPHSLYLQWIIWGGVLASCGWFLTLGKIWSFTLRSGRNGLTLVTGACLLGYAALEIFESVMRFSRVAGIFFLDLALLLYMVHSLQKESDVENPREERQ